MRIVSELPPMYQAVFVWWGDPGHGHPREVATLGIPLTSILMCIYIIGVSQSTSNHPRRSPAQTGMHQAVCGWIPVPPPSEARDSCWQPRAASELRDEGRADRLRPRRTHGASTRAVRTGRGRWCAVILRENTSPKSTHI